MYFDDAFTDAVSYVFDGTMLRSRFCCLVALVAHAPQSMWHGWLNEADSAAGCDEVDEAVWVCECGDSGTDSATIVIPSSSSRPSFSPHIGSDFGGGTFFAGIPDSQCPAALPVQHGIALALSSEAFAMRTGSAATKRHTKNRTPRERILCLLCFVVTNVVKATEPVLAGRAA